MAEAGENSPVYPQSYPQVYRWGWRDVGKIPDVARKIGADWLHVQYQTAAFHMHPAINFAPILWKRRGLRVAWTYHDLLVPYLFPKAGARLRRWVTERPSYTADLTIVTNEGDFQQLRGCASPLRKIPIGSNIQGQFLDDAARRRRRAQRGYDQSSLVIAYFGFLNRSKGGLTLIDTLDVLVRQGHNAHLLMIGERVGASDATNHAYLSEVEARIGQLGLGERVKWTGHQPDDEVSVDLNAADVLLMPYTDGVSLRRGTLMAGLVNGCAIVTTMPQSPLTELVDGRDLLLVPPEDPSSAAAAVAKIVTEDGLSLLLRANARQAAKQFSWPVIAQAHCDLYARW
jgi:glycosyltransferase involved in cell wall biosynthesis